MTALGGYLVYGLLTARYRLDREAFDLRWGMARERIPINRIRNVSLERDAALAPSAFRAVPGFVLGRSDADGIDREFFATDTDRLIRVEYGDKHLLISPPDPEAFLETFVSATRMGSLQVVEPLSQRPDMLPAKLWSDLLARILISLGLFLPLVLLGHLALEATELPPVVRFGFLPGGQPGPQAPPGRLLLLPLISGLVWLLDLLLGAWLYRRPHERPIAYLVWGMAIVVGALFWGALMSMLAVAA